MGSILYLFILMRFLGLLSSFHLIVTNSSSSMQKPLCHDKESFALLQFKQSFLIDEYASEDSYAYPKVATWKSHGEGRDCCSWHGVECDRESGHVIGLHLASSCLYGSINCSSTLFSLVHLRRLDLSGNDFNYSRIPHGVGQLSRLRSLNLSSSQFSGQIPSELLALSKLVSLDLSSNPTLQLQKPDLRNLVQNLTHLKELHLSQVNISSTVPVILANLSSLRSLSLENCGLHGEFPMGIFKLPSLELLDLNSNRYLTGYLPEFHNASHLKYLDLYWTSFSGQLPASIGFLSSLKELDICSCNFSGMVPTALGNLTQLVHLDLSNNSFKGQLTSSLANLIHLNFLYISRNDFSVGTLSWIVKLTKLTELELEKTNLNGEILPSLSNLTGLTYLNLEYNQLTGRIPPCLGNLTLLKNLGLGYNNLEGPIPSSIFELMNLDTLFLRANKLSGTVELNMLVKLKNLQRLGLSHNDLSLLTNNSLNGSLPRLRLLGLASCNLSEFPHFLRNQDELKFLTLSDNKIHGQIPKWMWNMGKETLWVMDLSNNLLTRFEQAPVVLPWITLRVLELSYNQLQGSLPVPPSSISDYFVHNNRLNGKIPSLICSLHHLHILDLSNNNLSGMIPQCLSDSSDSLSVLNLRGNNFHGSIPQTFTSQCRLKMIDFSYNQLEGQIPRSLGNCKELEILNLGNNQINDTFPFWLGSLPELQLLILRHNRFHGAIESPRANFEFPTLCIIDLSYNNFAGNLPAGYFLTWVAMSRVDEEHFSYMQSMTGFVLIRAYRLYENYNYSMTMTNKGMERVYPKIPRSFKAIDLSSNKFIGEIPKSIGKLRDFICSTFPPTVLLHSLRHWTYLKTISQEIPQQLKGMTFLEFFNVSHNHLIGPIPQGKQFNTFQNDSYEGNPGLCGNPLSKECGNSKSTAPPPPTDKHGGDLESGRKVELMIVLMGYGSGLVVGMAIGYTLTTRKHEWFVKTFGKRQRKC
ncbi:hypothetical protein AAG906_040162 [Vitis piasezkii]